MLKVKLITVGTLKEDYLRAATAEYEKRLSAFCRFEQVQLKEEKLPELPSQNEIKAALDKEAMKITEQISSSAFCIALCVEGKQLSSEEFAEKLEAISMEKSEIVLVIGSSYGLSDTVKQRADMKFSVSRLTFPHQLMRPILLEALYRAFNIQKGTKYHK